MVPTHRSKTVKEVPGYHPQSTDHCLLGQANHGVPHLPDFRPQTHQQERLRRMHQPMTGSRPVPTARFNSSKLDTATLLRKTPFFRLPDTVREQIWTYVLWDPSLFHYVAPGKVEFGESHGITNLPALLLSPKSIVKLLNLFTASKTWYQDSTSVWFNKFLPQMVSEVHNILDYEILEKYILWECPSHFVRFCWTSPFPKLETLAIHRIQMRTIVADCDRDSVNFAGKFLNNAGMQEAMTEQGFFPAHVHEQAYDKNGLPFAHRPPAEPMLTLVLADGEIGSIFWWIHAWFDKVVWNRAHWKCMSGVLQDFQRSMRYWVEHEGPVANSRFRFGCILSFVRRYQFELERMRCWTMANAALQEWKDDGRI